ncbi:PAS domain S-box protein [uncultured Methanospirillum sp.]|uniref:PAS domain S-box protein n=1 Tax=uncultured Methanospirillum sp. TaxID=262503 RepID=UPI0029C6108B|nr:PAS domain S-box protein [uncultured Methanospirillum sp.]
MDLLYYFLGIVLILLLYLVYTRQIPSLNRETQYFQKVLSAAPFPAIITGLSDKKIQMINERAAHLFEVPVSGTTRPNAVDFFSTPEKLEDIIQALLNNEKIVDYELRLMTRHGREFWALLSANLIATDNTTTVFMAFADITHQKELEAVTLKNKELYKSIIRTSPDNITMVDTLGKIFMLSPAAFQMFGYSLHDHYPYGTPFFDMIHPADRGRAKQDIRRLKAGDNTGPSEYRAWKKDGSIIYIESHAEVIRDDQGRPDSILYIIRDITRRKESEKIIRENEEKFTTIFQEVPDPLIIFRNDGVIIDLNRQCEQWFSVEKKTCIGSHLQKISLFPTRDTETDLASIILNLSPGEKIETQISLPDGSRRHTILSTQSITISGNPAKLLLINNIDEIKKAYQALALANNQINLLTSITRHDILNKVMLISGYSEILKEDIKEDSVIQTLEIISQSGKDIQSLIGFTKEYQDLGALQPKWQSIHFIMRKQVIRSMIADITLVLPDVALEIFADPMLEKVLYNLVENSMRHGGKISGITMFHEFDGEDCILNYTDDGLGIAEAEKEMIFRKGYGKNTGLGLFIIREILILTGITITETGTPGNGVRFKLRIPAGSFRITSEIEG